MLLGKYERVTFRDRVLVENGHELIVFIDYLGWNGPLNDIAENTVQVGDIFL